MASSSSALDLPLSDSQFDRLRCMVRDLTGISLTDSKRELLYGRLARRVRTLRLGSFGDYCALVERGEAAELQELTNAMTTNLTSFFREKHHFARLANEVLPSIFEMRARTRRVRLWSAGCSTGEEAYSLAMVLREFKQDSSGWDLRLLATDIDSKVLNTAGAGRYAIERLSGIDAHRLRWFERDEQKRCYAIAPELKSLILFKLLNLVGPWPFKGPFDVIFCRNVAIYFDRDTQRQVFERMADIQEPGGWLFIGHSESLLNVTRRYQAVGHTIYRRVS